MRGWCPGALSLTVMELSPNTQFQSLHPLLSQSVPSSAPCCVPGPRQAPPGPRVCQQPAPLLGTRLLSPAPGKRCVRVLCKSARDKPETSVVAGRVTEGTSANEPGCPMALPLAFKRGCQEAVLQRAGQPVSASERCEIPFLTCSCLENRQQAAVLLHPVQLLDEWEGKPDACQKVCGSWYGQEPGFKPQNYPGPGLEETGSHHLNLKPQNMVKNTLIPWAALLLYSHWLI